MKLKNCKPGVRVESKVSGVAVVVVGSLALWGEKAAAAYLGVGALALFWSIIWNIAGGVTDEIENGGKW